MSVIPKFTTFKTKELKAHKNKVHTLGWSCDGKWLASGAAETSFKVWNMERQRDPIEMKGHTDNIELLAWDPTRPDVLISTSRDKTIRIWDMRTEKSTCVTTEFENVYIACHPDGNTVALGNFENVINFLDIRKLSFGTPIKFRFEANEMSWNPAGDLFFLTTGEGTVSIYEYPTLKESYEINAHTGTCSCIKFDPKRRYFATGSADTLVGLWDIEELVCVRTFSKLSWPVRSIGFSFDGEFLAAGSEDDFIEISNVLTGETAHQIQSKGATNCLAWHPSKHILAYAGDDPAVDAGYVKLFGV